MGNLGSNGLTAVATLLSCPFYMKSVIYCRVSTKEQVENFSLGSQEKQCREYAKKNGYEVVKVFVDKGESAKTTDRPEFLRMIDYCRKNKGEIKAVIVYKVDRFSRNQEDHHTIKGVLRDYKVRLVSASEDFDESPSGHLAENLTSAVAQFNNEVRAERTRIGLKARFDNGLWSGPAPFGYKNITKADGKKVVELDTNVAPLITFAFEEFSKGIYTEAQLTRKLQRKGLKTKTGKKLWPQFVGNILKKKFYAGYMFSKTRNEEKKGQYKPIISIETFNKVQLILKGKTFLAVPHIKCRQEYPLRGFVKCSFCEHPLTASQSTGHGGKYHYYHCIPNRAMENPIQKRRWKGNSQITLKQSSQKKQDSSYLEKLWLTCGKQRKKKQGLMLKKLMGVLINWKKIEKKRLGLSEMR